jgi:FtsH-binding integral membrane protein
MSGNELIELFAYFSAIVALTWRFSSKRPAMTTIFDRFALTGCIFATLSFFAASYRFRPWVLIFGLAALVVAWHFRAPRLAIE